MSDMQAPPIKEGVTMPDNPYTRMLEAITQGRPTVSLPPPVPTMTPSTPGAFVENPDGTIEPVPDGVPVQTGQTGVSPAAGPLSGFQGIDLRTNEILGDNGEAFALTGEEVEEVTAICFRIAERETLARLETLRDRLGMKKHGPRKK